MSATILLRQIRAELLKARRRGIYLGTFAVLLIFAISPLISGADAWHDPHLRTWATAFVTLPHGLWANSSLIQLILPKLALVMGAAAVGGEYSARTWKMLLPRTTVRSSTLAARFLATLILCVGGLWVAQGVSLASAALGAHLIGVPFAPAGSMPDLWAVGAMELFFLLNLAINVSLGMLAALITQSLIGGFLTALVAEFLIRGGAMLPAGWLLPFANLDYLQARWFPQTGLTVRTMRHVMGGPLPWPVSLASVVVFAASFLLLGAWFFGRRDIAAE